MSRVSTNSTGDLGELMLLTGDRTGLKGPLWTSSYYISKKNTTSERSFIPLKTAMGNPISDWDP